MKKNEYQQIALKALCVTTLICGSLCAIETDKLVARSGRHVASRSQVVTQSNHYLVEHPTSVRSPLGTFSRRVSHDVANRAENLSRTVRNYVGNVGRRLSHHLTMFGLRGEMLFNRFTYHHGNLSRSLDNLVDNFTRRFFD